VIAIEPPPAVVAPAPKPDPTISAALTQTKVQVSSTFRGARIVLYGAVFNPHDRPTDVIVVVRGPPQPVRLVRKINVAGLWLNSRPVLFLGAPGFYMASATRDLPQIAEFGALRRLSIGVDHLKLDAPDETRVESRFGVPDVVVSRLEGDYLDWRRALIRLKEKARLYADTPGGVRFVDKGLFRAEVSLPTEAPVGRYETEVWLFQDGQPVSVRRRALYVEKVGIERSVYDAAHGWPWLYGIVSVLFALGSGWLASKIFRRN
jgi:uncharacterized protein (TIGR02186 family)